MELFYESSIETRIEANLRIIERRYFDFVSSQM
jgi:hypothetical protein